MKVTKFGRTLTIKQWKGEKLKEVIGVDTETELIKEPSHVPKLVLTTAYDGGKNCYIIRNQDVKEFLTMHQEHTLVFHNAPFDLNVLTKQVNFEFWDMIESGKIIDTMLLFQLVAIATRGYTHKRSSLDYVVSNLLNNTLPKDKDIRLTFGQYIKYTKEDGSISYSSVSKAHIVYACLDPVATLLCYNTLKTTIKHLNTETNLAHTIHLMGHIALDAITRRGIEVDLEYANNLRDELQAEMEVEANILASYGWTRGKKGVQESYNKIIDFLELDLPTTKHGYSMASEHLETYNDHPFVQSLLRYLELEHHKGFLNEMTTSRIHPRYETIKNTGRTSAFKPNIQNPPRKGGIREAMIPKEGHAFIDVDYNSIEMYTVAYHMKTKYGKSVMYDVLQEGRDPHLFVASIIYDKPESEITKNQRQAAKIANYGFLANMSPETFVDYAGSFGAEFTLDQAKKIKKSWTDAYPEIRSFWKSGYKAQGFYKSKTGFIRVNCSYTAWLNNHFQGPAAEGAKIAMYFAHKSGFKLVAFVHDSLVAEEPKEGLEAKLELLRATMIEGMKKICPMNIKAEGMIKMRYS